MPITKQTSIVPSRMRMSIGLSFSRSFERRGFRVLRKRIGWEPKENALDDEQQQAGTADRDRQIGEPDRQEREIGNGVVPGDFDEPLASDDHEDRNYCH